MLAKKKRLRLSSVGMMLRCTVSTSLVPVDDQRPYIGNKDSSGRAFGNVLVYFGRDSLLHSLAQNPLVHGTPQVVGMDLASSWEFGPLVERPAGTPG